MGLLNRFRRKLIIAFLLLPFYHAAGQVVAGISANGRIIAKGDTVNVCQGNSITFQSVGQGSINITWRFQGTSTTTGSGLGPFVLSYPTVGFDTVFQKITGGNYVDSTYLIVQVSNQRPTADFSWSPNGDCGNTPVQFSNLSTGLPLTYTWNFGDGGSSAEASPSYSFLNAVGVSGNSSYPVTLSVLNNYGCTATSSHTVTVKNTPDASIGNADANVQFNTFYGVATFKRCNNIPAYTFSFTNQSTTTSINNGYTIQWGDGSPDSTFSTWPSGVVITHTFPLGSSTMLVKVAGANGCTGIKKYIVFLGSTPAGGLASLGNTDICSSDSLRFNINNADGNPPGTQYTFLINDGSLPQIFQHPAPATVSHFFSLGSCSFNSSSGNSVFNNAFGAYLTIENPCGTTSPSVVPIYVSGKPRASIYVYPSRTTCAHANVVLESTSTYGSVITATGGSSSTCTNSGIQVWTITPSTGYTIITGSTGSLNGNPGNGQLWTGGSGALNVQFNTPGSYTVKLYVYNNRCGLDSTFDVVCVRNPPQASFTMPAKSHCGPYALALTNTSPVGSCGGDAYDWEVTYLDPLGCGNGGTPYAFTGGTSSSSSAPTLQLSSPGKYAIQLTVSALNSGSVCSPATMVDTFTIIGTPKVSINPLSTICPNSTLSPQAKVDSCYSPGPFTYQWQFPNGTPASSTDVVPGPISYTSIGNATVSFTLTDSYCNTTATANAQQSVVAPPTAFAGSDMTICSGNTVTLGKPGETGVTYHWTPNTGLSSPDSANPTLVYNYTGTSMDTTITYTVVASTSGNCSSTASLQVTIKRKPAMTITPAAPVLCINDTVQLIAQGADIYHWTPAVDRSNTTGDTVMVKPSATTTYTLIGQFNGGCPDTVTVKVTVNPDAKALFTASSTTVCSGVNLSDLITVTPYPDKDSRYDWYDNSTLFGSNNSGAFPSYSINGQSPTDTIKLVTTSPYACKADSIQVVFQTIPGVTAHFTKSGGAGCGPLKIFFNNTSTPVATSTQFFWNFGNGSTSTLQQPDSIAFAPSPSHRDTTYYISLKAYNGCDTTSWKDSVKVYPDPWAAFTVSQILGCSPFSDTLINLSAGNNTAYYWDFGDGTNATVSYYTPLVHLYHTGVIDTFTVSLTATNRCGTSIDSLDIVVSPASIRPGILVNGNSLFGCAPFNANFVNSSSGAAQITVDFQDGSAPLIIPGNQPTISHQYLKAGVYNVSMRLSNSCTDTSIIRQVTVYTPPVPAFTLDPNPVCTGNPVVTSNTSTNGNTWLWEWGDGNTSNGLSATHVYGSNGNYMVTLTAGLVNDYGVVCQVKSSPVPVRVIDIIPAKIDTGATRPCAPYNMTVTATGVAAAGADAGSVSWTFYDPTRAPGSFQASGLSASYQYNSPGNYKVMLIVQNAAGCADTAIHSFTVSATPSLTATPFGTIYTCNTDTLIQQSVSAKYTGADALTYSWTINGQPAGAGNPFEYQVQLPTSTFDTASYQVAAMVTSNMGCADTMTMGTLAIRPLPPPRIVIQPDSILYQPDYTFSFTDSITRLPGVRYTWDFGDMNGQNTGASTTHTYGDTGVYYVKAYVADQVTGCRKADTTHVRILYIPGFLYVPNAICPGCSVAELRTFLPKGRGLKEYHLRIYNTWGQLLFETTRLDANGAPSEPWNARWQGSTVQQDAYRWQIEAKYINGTEWKGMVFPNQNTPVKSGFITVIR